MKSWFHKTHEKAESQKFLSKSSRVPQKFLINEFIYTLTDLCWLWIIPARALIDQIKQIIINLLVSLTTFSKQATPIIPILGPNESDNELEEKS